MTPDDSEHQEVMALVRSVRDLQQRAAQQYQPVVDDILRTGSRDARQIERTLDGPLDFSGHEPVLAMYKQLCRHYWAIDPTATADYINVAAKMALVTAGASADVPASPMPPGASVLLTMWVSISGASLMRSTRASWKFDCSIRPFYSVAWPYKDEPSGLDILLEV